MCHFDGRQKTLARRINFIFDYPHAVPVCPSQLGNRPPHGRKPAGFVDPDEMALVKLDARVFEKTSVLGKKNADVVLPRDAISQ